MRGRGAGEGGSRELVSSSCGPIPRTCVRLWRSRSRLPAASQHTPGRASSPAPPRPTRDASAPSPSGDLPRGSGGAGQASEGHSAVQAARRAGAAGGAGGGAGRGGRGEGRGRRGDARARRGERAHPSVGAHASPNRRNPTPTPGLSCASALELERASRPTLNEGKTSPAPGGATPPLPRGAGPPLFPPPVRRKKIGYDPGQGPGARARARPRVPPRQSPLTAPPAAAEAAVAARAAAARDAARLGHAPGRWGAFRAPGDRGRRCSAGRGVRGRRLALPPPEPYSKAQGVAHHGARGFRR